MADEFDREVTHDEEQAIAAFMMRLAGGTPITRDVADPVVIWWKAELLRRWDVERKVQMPLNLMEPVQMVAGLAAAGLVLVWSLPVLTKAVSSIFG